VNDVYSVVLRPGTTYRFAFRSGTPCASVGMYAPDRREILAFACSGYRTFTPGLDGGGRYVLDVEAAPDAVTQAYALRIAAAGPDDVGIGVPLLNRVTRLGSLSPSGVDVTDIYHFDVPRLSDVVLRLAQPGPPTFGLALLTDTGIRLATSSAGSVARRLPTGRCVVAIQAAPGVADGAYDISPLGRDLKTTTRSAGGSSTTTVPLGQVVAFFATTTPAATGIERLQIGRFDPLTGWQFVRLVNAAAPSASIAWTPPAAGRWRARVTYRGSITSSPSRSGYVDVVVK
jgi:hypothetical protein